MDQIDATEIRVGLDDLDLEFLSEEVPSALRESEEGLERMAHIVRVMKEFSRSGEECTTIDLNRAVENVVEVSHNEWKDIAQVRLELGADVGEISCHAGELKLALLNIVVNAAQAIGEDCRTKSVTATGTIVVSTVREENGWRISVTDDGPGMTEDVRRRVFDPFFTTKPVGQGTGQGLALAHTSIVRRHGGTLTVVSTPGQGSIFTIHLPVRLPERNLVSAGAASIST
jgi:signal transduction histidine kinase